MSGSTRAADGAALIDVETAETIRMTVAEAEALGMQALGRIGYPENEARIITEHLIDNALCGYRFAGLPRNEQFAECRRG